jgi:TfoX/Sxy family transcriptional regulator of competence genes
MVYDQQLADRIRKTLADQKDVEEKTMFGGVCFMVNGKMCVCVGNDEMMCRIGPEKAAEIVESDGCRPMVHNGRLMKGFVFLSPEVYKNKKDFDRWITLCLEFNKIAKASKKKSK